MGEGELARVLAAVETLTSQVSSISTAVQQQQQGLEEVRRVPGFSVISTGAKAEVLAAGGLLVESSCTPAPSE